MTNWPLNMEQLDAAAAWEEHTQWEGRGPEPVLRKPATSRCWISAMRDGRYRVLWTSAHGTNGVDGPFGSFDIAAGWCERYERDLGWRWVR